MSSTKHAEQTKVETYVDVGIEAEAPIAIRHSQTRLVPSPEHPETNAPPSTEWVATYAKRTTVVETTAPEQGCDAERRMIEEVVLAAWVVKLIVLIVISLGAVGLDHSFGWIGKLLHIGKLVMTYVIKWISMTMGS